MEIIIGAIVFGLIIIAIIVMVIINFSYRSVKKRREEMEDEHYQHLKEKESRRPNLLISRQSRSRSSRSSPSNRNSLESRPLSKTSKKKLPVGQ